MAFSEQDSVFDKLAYLSMISRICTKLEHHHMGGGDKVLADLIAEVGRNCEIVVEFLKELKQNGLDMPHNVMSLCCLTVIHFVLPRFLRRTKPWTWLTNIKAKSEVRSRKRYKISKQNKNLPIYKLQKELIQAVRENQVLVVTGETGSGKDSSQFGCGLGEEVGYAICFKDCTGPETVIKYMTDWMLFRENSDDDDLSQYYVIMLDEASERTIHTDVLFKMLEKAS
ncbi:hypothetical protein OROHE_005077 [Orobanche hederae]